MLCGVCPLGQRGDCPLGQRGASAAIAGLYVCKWTVILSCRGPRRHRGHAPEEHRVAVARVGDREVRIGDPDRHVRRQERRLSERRGQHGHRQSQRSRDRRASRGSAPRSWACRGVTAGVVGARAGRRRMMFMLRFSRFGSALSSERHSPGRFAAPIARQSGAETIPDRSPASTPRDRSASLGAALPAGEPSRRSGASAQRWCRRRGCT